MSFKYVKREDYTDEKTSIHWWKEITTDLPEVLKNLKGSALLVHNSIEFTDIIDFLNETRPNSFLNVLYISLLRSYRHMKVTLEQKPLQEKKMFVIDCVSGYVFLPENNIDNCYYHKPPSNVTEVKEIIEQGIQKSNPDIIIFDSLSRFINFSSPTDDELHELYKFLKTINQSTFILLYDNKMLSMKKLPKHGLDLVLRLEIEHFSSFKMI